jgi:hypothetical protein
MEVPAELVARGRFHAAAGGSTGHPEYDSVAQARREDHMGDFNRRTVLAAASVVAATGGAALAQAPAPARQKGPRVWLDLDQQELDDAYDQSK